MVVLISVLSKKVQVVAAIQVQTTAVLGVESSGSSHYSSVYKVNFSQMVLKVQLKPTLEVVQEVQYTWQLNI
jgi:hypothetical protein